MALSIMLMNAYAECPNQVYYTECRAALWYYTLMVCSQPCQEILDKSGSGLKRNTHQLTTVKSLKVMATVEANLESYQENEGISVDLK
jgi:predicted nucleic acid-binding Zn ribbon protein